MRHRSYRQLSFTLPLLLVACGAATPSATPTPASSSPKAPAPTMSSQAATVVRQAPLDVDPVAVALTVDGVTSLCDQSLATADKLLGEVRALATAKDEALTWDATLGKLDKARLAVRNSGDFPALMAVAHPDEAVRNAAKLCEPKVDKFDTAFFLDREIAGVVKRYAAKKETLSAPRARLLEHMLRDYRRNGLELNAAGQKRLTELNEALTKLGQEFDTNLANSALFLEATPNALEGLPPSYLETHKPGANGKVKITTDYPDYFPVIQYAKNRVFALELYKLFDNRAADKNVTVLEKIFVLRREKANLLGYATWADYVLEPRMAKTSGTVASFLGGLRTHLKKKGDEELKDFIAMHVKLGGKASDAIPISDRIYLEDQVRKEKYGLDSQELSKYFEVTRVKQGILDITSKLFGISYKTIQSPKWHDDVEVVEVSDTASKRVLGRFYFDLYPREGKYKHAAVFSIRETRTMDDGSRLMPIAAIECNFPKPGKTPALLAHHDVTTFFHEFGHVLHHLLSESELVSFAGTSVARDFVEAPSQMLEEWGWSKETLDVFAKHVDTNAPIPNDLFEAMHRSRGFGIGLTTQRQLFLAALDQTYHTRAPGFDSTEVLKEVQNDYLPFKYVEGTHFQATFGHLIGYDAGYYGYQWALSIAHDLFTRFDRDGIMNTKTATEYRNAVLSKGGSEDEAKLVAHFLGRPPSDAAYRSFLLKAPPAKATAKSAK